MSALTYLKSAKSAPAGVQPKLLFAAARNRIHDNVRSLSGSALSFVARHPFVLSKYAPDSFALDFCNFYVSATGIVPITNSYQLDKVSLEYGGSYVPVTFGGGRSVTVGAGAANVLPDLVSRSALGIPENADGQILWVRIEGKVLAAGNIPVGGETTYPGTFSKEYSPGLTTITNGADGVGPLAWSGTNIVSNATQYCMPVVVGYYPLGFQQTIRSVIGLGDSITMGTHDTYAAAGVVGPSWFGRAMHDPGANTNVLPSMNCGRSGAFSLTYNTPGNLLSNYFNYATIATERFGVNDFAVPATSNITNATQMYASCKKLWDILRAKGIKVIRVGLTPKGGTSDNYTTLAGQATAGGVWNQGGQVQSYNALLPSGVGVDFDVYVPTTLRSPTADALWDVNGTEFYSTQDGTHPYLEANEREAVPVRSVINSITL